MSQPVRAADLIVVEEAGPLEVPNVLTGELVEVTLETAPVLLEAAREMKQRLGSIVHQVEGFLAEESARQGTKTFHVGGFKIEGKGGATVSYDSEALMEALRAADCPEDRIIGPQGQAVFTAQTEYKLNRSVLRQLTAANENYKAAAELAEERTETPLRFSVKPGA